jgi:hypothetical protein
MKKNFWPITIDVIIFISIACIGYFALADNGFNSLLAVIGGLLAGAVAVAFSIFYSGGYSK